MVDQVLVLQRPVERCSIFMLKVSAGTAQPEVQSAVLLWAADGTEQSCLIPLGSIVAPSRHMRSSLV